MCFPSGGPSAPGRRLSSRPQGQGGSLVNPFPPPENAGVSVPRV